MHLLGAYDDGTGSGALLELADHGIMESNTGADVVLGWWTTRNGRAQGPLRVAGWGACTVQTILM